MSGTDEARPGDLKGAGQPGRTVISSAELFGGARQIVIDHQGDRYLLRITRQNKLILNK